MTVAFDTLKAAQRLSNVGFSQEQASTIVITFVESITENLATKDDLELVRKDIAALDTKIDTSITALETKIDTSIAALETKIDTSIAALETKIDTSIAALETKIDTSIAALDTKIDTSIAALDTKIDTSITALRQDMSEFKKEMKIMLGSIMVAGITVMTMVMTFLAN